MDTRSVPTRRRDKDRTGDEDAPCRHGLACAARHGQPIVRLVASFPASNTWPQTTVKWYLESDELVQDDVKYGASFRPENGTAELVIRRVVVGDAGQYTVVASSATGEAMLIIDLTVAAPECDAFEGHPDKTEPSETHLMPFILLLPLEDQKIRVGNRARFTVAACHPPEPRIHWFRDERPVTSGDRIEMSQQSGVCTLDIAAVQPDDDGTTWKCEIVTGFGYAVSTAKLHAIVPKGYHRPEFLEKLKASLTAQGTVSLECKVVGVPAPMLRWFKGEREIRAGDMFNVGKRSSDSTDDTAAAADDDVNSLGVYTCVATNCMGKAISSAQVNVTDGLDPGSRLKLHTEKPTPVFTRELEDVTAKVGDDFRFYVRVGSPSHVVVDWYHEDELLLPPPPPDDDDVDVPRSGSDRYRFSCVKDDGSHCLDVLPLELTDGGLWRCVATNQYGNRATTRCTVTLTVPKKYREPEFVEDLVAIFTDDGLVSFECKVVGMPTPILRWYKDGMELKAGDVHQLSGTNSMGTYSCIASNCMGSASSVAELTIEDISGARRRRKTPTQHPPRFTQHLRDQTVVIGEDFRFTVSVTCPPIPEITWYKDNVRFEKTRRHGVKREKNGVYHLDIEAVETTDQGVWKCLAVNDYGHSLTQGALHVLFPKQYKKPMFIENLRAVLSEEGTVSLECKVVGVPQPALKWYKDGVELKAGDIYKIVSGDGGTSSLGTYTCEARNCMGTATSTAALLAFDDKCLRDREVYRRDHLSTITERDEASTYGTVSAGLPAAETEFSIYETPDITEDEARQIVELFADEVSEYVSTRDAPSELPQLRFVKESAVVGNVLMEALIIDVPLDCTSSRVEDMTSLDNLATEADVADFSVVDPVIVDVLHDQQEWQTPSLHELVIDISSSAAAAKSGRGGVVVVRQASSLKDAVIADRPLILTARHQPPSDDRDSSSSDDVTPSDNLCTDADVESIASVDEYTSDDSAPEVIASSSKGRHHGPRPLADISRAALHSARTSEKKETSDNLTSGPEMLDREMVPSKTDIPLQQILEPEVNVLCVEDTVVMDTVEMDEVIGVAVTDVLNEETMETSPVNRTEDMAAAAEQTVEGEHVTAITSSTLAQILDGKAGKLEEDVDFRSSTNRDDGVDSSLSKAGDHGQTTGPEVPISSHLTKTSDDCRFDDPGKICSETHMNVDHGIDKIVDSINAIDSNLQNNADVKLGMFPDGNFDKSLNADLEKFTSVNMEQTEIVKLEKSDSNLEKAMDVNLEKTMEVNLEKGMEVNLEKAMEVNLEKGIDVNLGKGMDFNLEKGIDVTLEEGIDVNLEKAIDVNLEKGMDVNSGKALKGNLEKCGDSNEEKAPDVNFTKSENSNLAKAMEDNLEKASNVNVKRGKEINLENETHVNVEKTIGANLEKSTDVEMEKTGNADLEKVGNVNLAKSNLNLKKSLEANFEKETDVNLDLEKATVVNLEKGLNMNLVKATKENVKTATDVNLENAVNVDFDKSNDVTLEMVDGFNLVNSNKENQRLQDGNLEKLEVDNFEKSGDIHLEKCVGVNPKEFIGLEKSVDVDSVKSRDTEQTDKIDSEYIEHLEKSLEMSADILSGKSEAVQFVQPKVNLEKHQNVNLEKHQNVNLEKQIDVNWEKPNDVNLEQQTDVNLEQQTDVNLEQLQDVNLEQSTNVNLEKPTNVNLHETNDINLDKQLMNDNLEKSKDINLEKTKDVNSEKPKDVNVEKLNDVNLGKIKDVNLEPPVDTASENLINVIPEECVNMKTDNVTVDKSEMCTHGNQEVDKSINSKENFVEESSDLIANNLEKPIIVNLENEEAGHPKAFEDVKIDNSQNRDAGMIINCDDSTESLADAAKVNTDDSQSLNVKLEKMKNKAENSEKLGNVLEAELEHPEEGQQSKDIATKPDDHRSSTDGDKQTKEKILADSSESKKQESTDTDSRLPEVDVRSQESSSRHHRDKAIQRLAEQLVATCILRAFRESNVGTSNNLEPDVVDGDGDDDQATRKKPRISKSKPKQKPRLKRLRSKIVPADVTEFALEMSQDWLRDVLDSFKDLVWEKRQPETAEIVDTHQVLEAQPDDPVTILASDSIEDTLGAEASDFPKSEGSKESRLLRRNSRKEKLRRSSRKSEDNISLKSQDSREGSSTGEITDDEISLPAEQHGSVQTDDGHRAAAKKALRTTSGGDLARIHELDETNRRLSCPQVDNLAEINENQAPADDGKKEVIEDARPESSDEAIKKNEDDGASSGHRPVHDERSAATGEIGSIESSSSLLENVGSRDPTIEAHRESPPAPTENPDISMKKIESGTAEVTREDKPRLESIRTKKKTKKNARTGSGCSSIDNVTAAATNHEVMHPSDSIPPSEDTVASTSAPGVKPENDTIDVDEMDNQLVKRDSPNEHLDIAKMETPSNDLQFSPTEKKTKKNATTVIGGMSTGDETSAATNHEVKHPLDAIPPSDDKEPEVKESKPSTEDSNSVAIASTPTVKHEDETNLENDAKEVDSESHPIEDADFTKPKSNDVQDEGKPESVRTKKRTKKNEATTINECMSPAETNHEVSIPPSGDNEPEAITSTVHKDINLQDEERSESNETIKGTQKTKENASNDHDPSNSSTASSEDVKPAKNGEFDKIKEELRRFNLDEVARVGGKMTIEELGSSFDDSSRSTVVDEHVLVESAAETPDTDTLVADDATSLVDIEEIPLDDLSMETVFENMRTLRRLQTITEVDEMTDDERGSTVIATLEDRFDEDEQQDGQGRARSLQPTMLTVVDNERRQRRSSHGGRTTSSSRRTSKDSPSFIMKLRDMVVPVDYRMRLTCCVIGTPDPKVTWLKDGVPVTPDMGYREISDFGICVLEIPRVSPSDSATFTCVARNDDGEDTTSAQLTVKGTAKPNPVEPAFTRSMLNMRGHVGDSITMDCTVIGWPTPQVQWLKDNAALVVDADRMKMKVPGGGSGGTHRLSIREAVCDDSGVYRCVAANLHGRDEITATVKITDKPSTSRFVRDSLVSPTKRNRTSAAVEEVDFGYESSAAPPSTSPSPPPPPLVFTSPLGDATVRLGSDVTLRCELLQQSGGGRGSPHGTVDVSWFHNCRPLLPPAEPRGRGRREQEATTDGDDRHLRFGRTADGTGHTLTLLGTSYSDLGLYTCRASDARGAAYTSACLSFGLQGEDMEFGVAPAFICRPQSLRVTRDQPIVLTCKVEGSPTPKVTWLKGARDMSLSWRAYKDSKGDIHKLVIHRAMNVDDGEYVVEARNRLGKEVVRCTVTISKPSGDGNDEGTWDYRKTASNLQKMHGYQPHVPRKELPGPVGSEPRISETGRNWVTLVWQRPRNDGDSCILSYRIESRRLPDGDWEEVGLSPITICDVYNLKPDVEYLFRVSARNMFGWGPPLAIERAHKIVPTPETPYFTSTPPAVLTAHRGSTVVLEFTVGSCKPVPQHIGWYKDGSSMSDWLQARATYGTTGRPTTNFDGITATLTVPDVIHEDEGCYVCEAMSVGGGRATATTVVVIVDHQAPSGSRSRPPSITERLRDCKSVVDGPISLRCHIEPPPPSSDVQWFKDGVQIRNQQTGRVVLRRDATGSEHILDISRARLEDCGEYMFRTGSEHGSASSSCQVTVVPFDHRTEGQRRPSPAFLEFLENSSAVEGQSHSLRCRTYGPPDPTASVSWSCDGRKLDHCRKYRTRVSADGTCALTIDRVTADDEGTYTCMLTNDSGTAHTSAQVHVPPTETPPPDTKPPPSSVTNHAGYSKVPVFLTKPRSTAVLEGDSVELICEVIGDPKPEVLWLRDGLTFDYERNPEHFGRLGDGPVYRLRISTVDIDDTAAYAVVATNCHGQAKAIVSLQVFAKGQPAGLEDWHRRMANRTPDESVGGNGIRTPAATVGNVATRPEVTGGLIDRECTEGDSVTLECHIEAVPSPDVRWEKDGKQIRAGDDFRIERDESTSTCRLVIVELFRDDDGEYACVAYTDAGTVVTKSRLTVRPRGGESTTTATVISKKRPMTTESNDAAAAAASRQRRYSGGKRNVGPRFVTHPHNRVVDEGESVRFTCCMAGHPEPVVRWEKCGRPLRSDGSRIQVVDKEDVHSLAIADVTARDAGTYTVTATNCIGRVYTSVHLDVIGRRRGKCRSHVQTPSSTPSVTGRGGAGRVFAVAAFEGPRILQPLSDQTAHITAADRLVTLSCSIVGRPRPTVSWALDGKPIRTSRTRYDGRLAKLDMSPSDQEIARRYVDVCCTASNAHGTIRTSARLTLIPSGSRSTQKGTSSPTKTKGLKPSNVGEPRGRKSCCATVNSVVIRADKEENEVGKSSRPPLPSKPTDNESPADQTIEDDHRLVLMLPQPDQCKTEKTESADTKESATSCSNDDGEKQDGRQTGSVLAREPETEAIASLGGATIESAGRQIQTEANQCEGMERPDSPEEVSVVAIVVVEDGDSCFDDLYEVAAGAELGKGRFGSVRLMTERSTGIQCAGKFVRCIRSRDKDKVREEMDIMNLLGRHPRILTLMAAFERCRDVILVLEYISGGELFERIVAEDFAPTERDCILFARQICDGVRYMHERRVMHLDLKPENVMCVRRDGHRIKIIDFGLAKIYEADRPVRAMFGTPEFVAPEVINYEPLSPASDMWSVGVVCYVMLSGLSPFMGENDAQTFANIIANSFDFDDDAFDGISQDAIDFIVGLLVDNKEKRMSAQQCLEHRWLSQHERTMSEARISTDKLKKFLVRRRWQERCWTTWTAAVATTTTMNSQTP